MPHHKLILPLLLAVALAGCGTTVYTTVKAGEGQELKQLVEYRDRDRYESIVLDPDRVRSDVETYALAVHPTSGDVYLADPQSDRIRRISGTGALSAFAGDRAAPRLNRARSGWRDAVTDAVGNVYVTEFQGLVRRIAPDGSEAVIAGGGEARESGPATSLQLSRPEGIAIDGEGRLYVADGRVWRLDPQPDGTYAAVADAAGPSIAGAIWDVAVAEDGTLFLANYGLDRNAIWRMPPGGTPTMLATVDQQPRRLALDAAGHLYVSFHDSGQIARVAPDGVVTKVEDDEVAWSNQRSVEALAVNDAQGLVVAYSDGSVRQRAAHATAWELLGAMRVDDPRPDVYVPLVAGLARAGDQLLVVQGAGRVSTLAKGVFQEVRARAFQPGTQERREADLLGPSGLAFRPDGSLLVADTGHRVLRVVSPEGAVSVFAGSGLPGDSDGEANEATFNAPEALAMTPSGTVYVADGTTVRAVAPDGRVTTPLRLAAHVVDLAFGGGKLYVITSQDPQADNTLSAYTEAGVALTPEALDWQLSHPRSVVVDTQGRPIVADDRFGGESLGTTLVVRMPDGSERVLVATRKGDKDGQVLGSFTVAYTPAPAPEFSPGDMAIGPDGKLFFIHHTSLFTLTGYDTDRPKTWWWPF